jgi:hypothetical protein
MKRIPIKAAKDLANKYGQTHLILWSWDGDCQHITTYGKSLVQCDQAANLGNDIKTVLDWPKYTHRTPSRVKKLLKQIKTLKQEVQHLNQEKLAAKSINKYSKLTTFGNAFNVDGSRQNDVYNSDQ